jgi:hypothetical protein
VESRPSQDVGRSQAPGINNYTARGICHSLEIPEPKNFIRASPCIGSVHDKQESSVGEQVGVASEEEFDRELHRLPEHELVDCFRADEVASARTFTAS